ILILCKYLWTKKLRSWSYCTLTSILEYKLRRVGIVLKKVSEKNIGAIKALKMYHCGSFFERNVPNCNSHVNSGNLVKWNESHLTCTEAPL
ncbi:MAG: hypothetical protein Q6356_004050, partial [Candidatus Wukongarchaeota archaeon]|nr:hypothetical protein [Candidatus Wukongarchaeota archaeon]